MTPEALEPDPRFQAAVEALAAGDVPVSDVVDLARHPDGWVASMALAALERRDDVPDEWADVAIRGLPRPSNCEDAFQLRALAKHAAAPAIGRILARTEGIRPQYVADFVRRRIAAGEDVDAGTFSGHVTVGQADDVGAFIDRYGQDMGEEVRRAFEEWRALELLGGVGRVWKRPYDEPPALLGRSTLGARRPRGGVAHRRPAPIGAPGRGARLREDGADPGSARPARRRGRVRGDGIAGARRSRVRRGAGRPGEAAGRGDARPGHGLGAARAPGGALRRAAPSQPARAPRCGASERGVGSDDDRRGGHPDCSRGAAGGAAARDERVRRGPAADARRGRLDRSGPPRARQRRPRRDDRRRDARPIVRPRPAVPPRRGAAREPAPTGARGRGRGRGAG